MQGIAPRRGSYQAPMLLLRQGMGLSVCPTNAPRTELSNALQYCVDPNNALRWGPSGGLYLVFIPPRPCGGA